METSEHLNLQIEAETTVEEDSVSCEITTAFQSADSPLILASVVSGGRS